MIEEIAIVTRAEGGRVWLKSRQGSACGGCVQKTSCTTAALAELAPGRELEVESPPGLQVGDPVRVAIGDAQLLSASVLLYLFPLLVMMAAMALAKALLPAAAAEAWMPEIALAGLLSAFGGIHRLQKRLLRRAGKPVIISGK
jgi:sigma-E factor negative regulatory protein RseC